MAYSVGQSSLPPTALKAFRELDVCDWNCLNDKECKKLHICRQFLYSGLCQYSGGEGENCRFGHDIKSGHNLSVLEAGGLGELSVEELRYRLKLAKKNLPVIPICEQYLKGRSHEMSDCPSMHICRDYLFTSCDGQCTLSHDLLKENCPTILRYYGVELTEENVGNILIDFQSLQTIQPVISRFLFDYKNRIRIGSGGFGVIYAAEHIIDKKKYAVKCINFSLDEIDKAKREVEIIASLQHPNIIRYFTCWIEDTFPFDDDEDDEDDDVGGEEEEEQKEESDQNDNFIERFISFAMKRMLSNLTHEDFTEEKCLCIQMELCHYEDAPGETLKDLILKEDKYELRLMDMFSQIANAVAYMHSQNIMHRDLKPENIFFEIADGYNIKVGDFGLARQGNCPDNGQVSYTKKVGTKSYMSPEMLNGEEYDKSTDVYSLGLLALTMFYPLRTEEEWKHVLDKTREQDHPCLPENSADYPFLLAVHPLLEKMLKNDPKERPTADEIKADIESLKQIL